MAKLKPEAWNGRQAAALADLSDAEDERFLRPDTPAAPARRKPVRGASGSKSAASRAADLVPNYDSADEAEAFLRARRRVAPRKGSRLRWLFGSTVGRIVLAVAALLVLCAAGFAFWAIRSFLQHDPHFRIDSSTSIEATGNTELSRTELVNVFGSDIGRNVFFVPLKKREAALEAEPWVRHATVMRLLPKTLRVTIEERVPVAFVRIGRQIGLVDADGVLLSMAPATLAARHYSFPVVVGLDPNSSPEARAERMQLFARFSAALDAGAAKITPQLSEVDLSDLDDVRAVVPAQGTDILLHFGNSDFLERYHSYQEHLPEWRQQYPNLSAVDLRYDRQVVLKMAEAARADELAEAKPLASPDAPSTARHTGAAARPGKTIAQHAAGHAFHIAIPAHRPAAGRLWYTRSRPTPQHPAHWVAHTLPAHPTPAPGGTP